VGRVFHRLLSGERAHLAAMVGEVAVAAAKLTEARESAWVAGRVFGLWADLATPWVTAARVATVRAREQAVALADRLQKSGTHALEALARHDAHRLGTPGQRHRLRELADTGAMHLYARHASADTAADVATTAAEFERSGRLPLAIEAYRQAGDRYADEGRADSSRRCRALAESLSRRCPGLPYTTGSGDFTLTNRERQTAHLALTGLTNRQIAEEMGVAKRTVDNHLATVYHKLGINTRVELGRFLG
jgi:DNA-binding CsgD family transcriptional regulator